MTDQRKILFTGGSGLLGSEFKKILPDACYPSRTDFDVTNYDQMDRYVGDGNWSVMIHAAAFTSPPKVDQDPLRAIDVNIIGTSNVVKLCKKYGLKLIYICTDYVFKGDCGNYKEDDPVFPVNKYAWSKLGGECAVRLYDNSIIVRTTFGPDVFPYEKAFVDQWTSRESVSITARMIAALLDKDFKGTVHVGGKRKSVFAYAKGLDSKKDIKELSIHEIDFTVPADTSMNCDLYNGLVGKK
ncbi:MAG: sugar nucleotide-binding protein [Deltaproteobacteria bacterium]|nr:sugar nucleotide-binding protein [Deltaproteobacteria bacterium]